MSAAVLGTSGGGIILLELLTRRPDVCDAAHWLAEQLNIPVTPFPGRHTPYFGRVDDLVAVLRLLLR